MLDRKKITEYILKKYKIKPERLWANYPDFEVFRHADNNKWFAIIMDVSGDKVGLDKDERVDIINIKNDPELVDLLSTQKGFCRAYHMNKQHWLTVILNGSVRDEEVRNLLEDSFEITK